MKAKPRHTHEPLPRIEPRGPRLTYYRYLAAVGADLIKARAAIVRTTEAVREHGLTTTGPGESTLEPPDESHRARHAVLFGTHRPPPRGVSGYIGDLCFDEFGTGLPGVVMPAPMALGYAVDALGNNQD